MAKRKIKKRMTKMAKSKIDNSNIWEFDTGYKTIIYYLGIIGVILGSPLIWIVSAILFFTDKSNPEFESETIISPKHMKSNFQKFIYIMGWLVAIGIGLVVIIAMGFIFAA